MENIDWVKRYKVLSKYTLRLKLITNTLNQVVNLCIVQPLKQINNFISKKKKKNILDNLS